MDLKTNSGYLTVASAAEAQYTEKRSRFIATAIPCSTETEAQSFLAKIRTKYWDARHNCYAFSVDNGATERFSDDGEPHGTAGKPILEVIKGAGIVNVAVVVTRYFGGVLLGTGGLVRAYSKATQDALSAAGCVQMLPCTVYETVCPYNEHARFENFLENTIAQIEKTDFSDTVKVIYRLPDFAVPEFLAKLTDAFRATLQARELNRILAAFPIDIANSNQKSVEFLLFGTIVRIICGNSQNYHNYFYT